MEAVHKSSNRAWIDPEVINVKEFCDEWTRALEFTNNECNEATDLKNLISEEEYKDIERMCGLEALRCEFTHLVESSDTITIPAGVNLKTLKLQEEDLRKRSQSKKYANAVRHKKKFCQFPPLKTLAYQTDLSSLRANPLKFPDVILAVQLFVPVLKVDTKTAMTSYLKMPKFQLDVEFLVLGCQFLTELRDKITCISDKAIPGNCCDCPTDEPVITCKDLYKSGFFYINGVFYNDMRDKDCRDYSEIIIKWASNERRQVGPFTKAAMEETKFIDLNIQLGYPYVYIHQGDCEHLMVFTDLRMLSSTDVDNRDAYPLYVQAKPLKRNFCMVCHKIAAAWVVYRSERVPVNPFFFCKKCFLAYNYDKDNQMIGEFYAFHLPDQSKLD